MLDLLLDQQQTANYITQKIYRFFVNETVENEKVDWLSKRFYQSDYNISQLIEDIFTADWFYDAKHIGTRIKSPIELVVGMQRILPMTVENEEALLLVQRLLGQLLFYPPNVAGWPGGKNWIDSSSLMFRLRLPQLFNDSDELNIRPKTDDDMTGGREANSAASMKNAYGKAGKPIQADIFWKLFTKQFDRTPRESLLSEVQAALLQVAPRYAADTLLNFADSSGRENFIKSTTIQIMSTPEYQMC